MLPSQFERAVLTYFASRGYQVTWTGGVGDGGKDGILRDWGGHIYIVQCKLYRGGVGAAAVRELIGTVCLNAAYGGFLITTGHFTRAAFATATGTSVQLVERFRLHDEPYICRNRPESPLARRSRHQIHDPLPPPYWHDMWG